MDGPVISPFSVTEHDRWRELFRAYNDFYGAQLTDDVYLATWERLITGSGPHFGLAARNRAGHAIGLAHYLFHGSTWSTEDVCYLEDLFVDPAARSGGYGRALIQGVAAAARAHGSKRLYWLTQENNAAARHLYDAVATLSGFIRYDIRL